MNFINISYFTLFKIRFINRLQYRIAAWAGLATQFAWGFMNILLFHAFYSENPANFPMTFEQFASYTWLNQALLMLFNTWFWDNSIFDDIMSGNIAYELARPVDLYNMWLVRNMATRLAGTALRCIPVLIVAFLLPKPFGLILPVNIFTFCLFIISAIFAFIIVNLYCMFYYIICFYTINSSGVRIIACSLSLIFSGHIIPLPFFPENILKVLNILPFASMQNMPFFIYSGYWNTKESLIRIMIQLIWIIIFYGLGKLWMHKTKKRIIVQGG
jgi:ABC-2 type transport system permease protein